MADLEWVRKIYHNWQGKKYDLNLNFLPMQIQMQSTSRKHHGLFMIIGTCRCLDSGEPLWYLALILVLAENCILLHAELSWGNWKYWFVDHHPIDQSHTWMLCFVLFKEPASEMSILLYVQNLKSVVLRLQYTHESLGFLEKCWLRNKQDSSTRGESKGWLSFQGNDCKGQVRTFWDV